MNQIETLCRCKSKGSGPVENTIHLLARSEEPKNPQTCRGKMQIIHQGAIYLYQLVVSTRLKKPLVKLDHFPQEWVNTKKNSLTSLQCFFWGNPKI